MLLRVLARSYGRYVRSTIRFSKATSVHAKIWLNRINYFATCRLPRDVQMTTTRFRPLIGVFAKVCLPLLASLLLVACNNADPYAGQNISGNILEPRTINPLDPNQSAVTQIALFANKPVTGLYYVCADNHSTRDYVHTSSSTTTDSSGASTVVVTPVPVALCGNDASAVTYYLGKQDAVNNTKNFVALGKLALPVFSPLGADGKHRFCNEADACGDQYGGVSASKFLFNRSLADLAGAPARLDVSDSFDTNDICKSGKSDACQIVYLMALLQALDANKGATDEISIANTTNDVLADPANAAAIHFSSLKLNYPNYADFKAAWTPFVNQVCANNACNGLPVTLTPSLAAEVTQGSARLGAGNYNLDYGSLMPGYVGYYGNASTVGTFSSKGPVFGVNFFAYPDGTLAAFGTAAFLQSACPNKPSRLEDVANYLICVVLNIKPANYVIAAGGLNSVAAIGVDGQLNNVHLQSLVPPTTGFGLDLHMVGRVLGNLLYDGRVPPSVPGRPSDFTLDYPSNNYVLSDSEKGSLMGDFFNFQMPDPGDGSVGGTTTVGGVGVDPAPFPVRIGKSGGGQTTPLDAAVLAQLSGQYYRLQLMRFCTQGESCTTVIPTAEVGSDAAANYADAVCPLGVTCDSTNPVFKPVNETPVTIPYGGTVQVVNIKFDTFAPATGFLNATLLNSSCAPVTDILNHPIRVGTVIATPTPVTNANDPSKNIAATADVTFFFSPPDTNSNSYSDMPLGVTLTGRIKLTDTTWPIYRLGDDNFLAGIRAHWQGGGYQMTDYLKTIGVTSTAAYDSLSLDEKQLATALAAGAVNGTKLDGSCQPVP